MRYCVLILLSVSILSSCWYWESSDEEDFKRNCPYELTYGGHYLRIPITVSPHKPVYRVGDTLEINTVFSDSIYDLGTQQTFKIEGFPFKPSSILYRFTSRDRYDSGYRVNELKVDSIYQPYFWRSTHYADGYRASTIYDGEAGLYRFESQLILKEPGRYILFTTDNYQNNTGSGNQDLNAEADAIRFEGQCLDDDGQPLLPYALCSMIDSGSDHLRDFEEELVYLDEKVYRGRLRFINKEERDFLKGGSISVEFSGCYGFEVIE